MADQKKRDEHIYQEPGMFATVVNLDEESLLPGLEDTEENWKKYEFLLEVEEVIQKIKNGEIPGEYFEF